MPPLAAICVCVCVWEAGEAGRVCVTPLLVYCRIGQVLDFFPSGWVLTLSVCVCVRARMRA